MVELKSGFDLAIDELLDDIKQIYDYDFKDYSKGSIRRRILQCMRKENFSSVLEIRKRLTSDHNLINKLIDYFTVPTSEMFRDPDFFTSFRKEVVSLLKTYPSLKIWVAGCSTGEEAYSYAIVLYEEGLLDRTIIYATDINPVVLKKARDGIYTLEKLKLFEENYIKSGGNKNFTDYYTSKYDSGIIKKHLKEKILFTDHSLVTDEVFSEVHFVSCRNVLIYFEKELQDRAIRLFKESLRHGGFLALGSKESLMFSIHKKSFSEFVGKQKIYQKKLRL